MTCNAQHLVKRLIESDDDDLDADRYFSELMSGWKPIDKISEEEWKNFFEANDYQLVRLRKHGRSPYSATERLGHLFMEVESDHAVTARERENLSTVIRQFVDDLLGNNTYRVLVSSGGWRHCCFINIASSL